jgi:hypothetical protein
MKRICGVFVLLAGFSGGCISFTAQPGPPENKTSSDNRLAPAKAQPASNGPFVPPAVTTAAAAPASVPGAAAGMPLPAMPQWSTDPATANPAAARAGMVDPTQATRMGMIDPTLRANPPQIPPPNPVDPALARRPASPPSLTPMVTTPRPTPTEIAAPRPPETVVMQPGVPMAVTPRSECSIRPVNYTPEENPRETSAAKTEIPLPPTPHPVMPMPSAPVVKNSLPGEAKPGANTGHGGPPLVRLVNTKRITLNFEVKDVGPSGLSSVELWYTQDGKEWKKYDAPTQAQAYVVEVDEEGMYGFTLLAKSGTGIGKEPPQAGDQPQVWVVVDLTRPEVQLNEVAPSTRSGQQSVSIKWQASDKNLSRQPVALYYAEREDGPWKQIACGLPNHGEYLWQVPQGTPARVLVRVEATDLAGNVGRAQLPKALLLDSCMPRVSIVNVEANTSN